MGGGLGLCVGDSGAGAPPGPGLSRQPRHQRRPPYEGGAPPSSAKLSLRWMSSSSASCSRAAGGVEPAAAAPPPAPAGSTSPAAASHQAGTALPHAILRGARGVGTCQNGPKWRRRQSSLAPRAPDVIVQLSAQREAALAVIPVRVARATTLQLRQAWALAAAATARELVASPSWYGDGGARIPPRVAETPDIRRLAPADELVQELVCPRGGGVARHGGRVDHAAVHVGGHAGGACREEGWWTGHGTRVLPPSTQQPRRKPPLPSASGLLRCEA